MTLVPHVTVGLVIAVPATPVGDKLVQLSSVAVGGGPTSIVPHLTVTFPPQFAVALTL